MAREGEMNQIGSSVRYSCRKVDYIRLREAMMNKISRWILPLLMVWVGIAGAQDIAIPPAAGAAESALADSPRHGEFVSIDVPGEDTKLKLWVVYPERPDKAPVVLVIHEIFGMTDWSNSVADHLASQGFIAIAPDMISNIRDNPKSTASGAMMASLLLEPPSIFLQYSACSLISSPVTSNEA